MNELSVCHKTKFFVQMNTLNAFNQLMQKIAGRMASDAQLIKDSSRFIKKASIQLSQMPDQGVAEETEGSANENVADTQEVLHKGKNFLTLGGVNDSEKNKLIACHLFEPEEL